MFEWKRADRGFTVTEVLISITILGALALVLTSALSVTFNQQAGSAGRLDVARASQMLSLYLPNDLASAAEVSTDPTESACPSACSVEPADSHNALLLSWTTPDHDVAVSYRTMPSPEGDYQLIRVKCEDANCVATNVANNLPSAAAADAAVAPVSPGDPATPATGAELKDASRIVITLDGGGYTAGRGGGENDVDLTMGATNRCDDLAVDSLYNAPTLTNSTSAPDGCDP